MKFDLQELKRVATKRQIKKAKLWLHPEVDVTRHFQEGKPLSINGLERIYEEYYSLDLYTEEDANFIAYCANNIDAIIERLEKLEAVAGAIQDDHRYYEPECPICIALKALGEES